MLYDVMPAVPGMASVCGERGAPSSVGATIKAGRRELAWSQEELAESVATRGN